MRTPTTSLVAALALILVPAAMAGTADHVEQYGVTITFDGSYTTGQFANGDFWVVPDGDGTVTVTAMDPAFDGTHHGWEANPAHTYDQGFDTRLSGFDASRVPDLPYDAAPGTSIVKTVSRELDQASPRPVLQKAIVLTVLSAPPPDDGATCFRPPYFGADKPLYRTTDLRPEHLPSLDPTGVSNVPSIEWVESRWQRVQLDHKKAWSGRMMHPDEHMPDYGSGICADNGAGALRLMLNDPVEDKMQALINYVQMGIDMYHMQLGGLTYGPDGGHNHGRKLPVAFAGIVLEHDGMKAWVREKAGQIYHEDLSVWYSPVSKMVLWGQSQQGESGYYRRFCQNTGSKTICDPYGYVDGGLAPGGSYQYCCNSSTWIGQILCVHLMPGLRELWNFELGLEYQDRWMDFGAWAQPDPYAPIDCENWGKLDDDPNDGIGRWPDNHGIHAGGGSWGNGFSTSMWQVFRPGDAAGLPAVIPYGGEFDETVEVTLESSPRTPGCQVRYTLDGTEPTAASPLYTEPLTLANTTTIRARAFKSGLTESAIHEVTFTYTGPDNPVSAWHVVAQHGGQELAAHVLDDYIEPRAQGIRVLRLTFRLAFDPATATLGAIAATGETSGDLSGRIASVTPTGTDQIDVTFDPSLPDDQWVTVSLTAALKDPEGQSFGGDLNIRLGTLVGDVNRSGEVSDADVVLVRDAAGTAVGATTAAYDVDGSGEVTGSDMKTVGANVGDALP